MPHNHAAQPRRRAVPGHKVAAPELPAGGPLRLPHSMVRQHNGIVLVQRLQLNCTLVTVRGLYHIRNVQLVLELQQRREAVRPAAADVSDAVADDG